MPRVIQVRTGTRLHFGPLASGAVQGRCFGGIGLMVAQPAIAFRAIEHSQERYTGCPPAISERVQRIRNTWESGARYVSPTPGDLAGQGNGAGRTASRIPPLSWEFDSAPIEHAGFGTGTQLSLAVASVLARYEGAGQLSLHELAIRCGRGRRSAIGVHGFAEGGFLVDAGKAGDDAIGDLAVRSTIPDPWRVVILRPRSARSGLSGAHERAAFETLPPMSAQLTDRLCRLTLMEILPAIHAGDCEAFSAAVSEYGRRIGEYFSAVQGGVFADPQVREIAHTHPALGSQLVQSSWGPTVVKFASSESAAIDFLREWASVLTPSEWSLEISPCLNEGAIIEETSLHP